MFNRFHYRAKEIAKHIIYYIIFQKNFSLFLERYDSVPYAMFIKEVRFTFISESFSFFFAIQVIKTFKLGLFI